MDRSERVAVYGGTFDPPQLGHVTLVERALACYGFDRVLVVPCGEPPHKQAISPSEVRFMLARLAFAGTPRVELCRYELETPGPHYTANTLRWASERFDDLTLLIGIDEFLSFPHWKEPEEILKLARLAVASRGDYEGYEIAHTLKALPEEAKISFFPLEGCDISSSEIRQLVSEGKSIEDLVPKAVAEEIACLGLYH
jgi:nicotinate-nucleotide adenylyltransferase